MSLTIQEQAVLRHVETGLLADNPGLSELARFFGQVFGAERMPRHERLAPRGCGPANVAATLFCRMLAGTWRLICRTARAIAAAEAWYAAALATGQAPVLTDVPAGDRPAGGRQAGGQGRGSPAS